jgi:protein O-mannosyl-transferase
MKTILSGKWKPGFLTLLLLGIVFLAVSPCLNNGFTNFDDDVYVTQNPMIRGLSWRGAAGIFANMRYAVIYTPLVFLTYAVEYAFSGLNPAVYHATNVILHLLNCYLVFVFILLLSKKKSVAFLTALMFGMHPLHVESVAWISERKDVLYAVFFLSSVVCYLYSLGPGRSKFRYGAAALFILALLAKPVAVVLPAVLLLCDYYLGRGVNKATVKEKALFAGIALVFLILGLYTAGRYFRRDPDISALDMFFVANYSLVFYLCKLIIPLRLSCLYPYPLKAGGWLPGIFYLSPFLTAAMGYLVVLSSKVTKKAVFGAVFFMIMILPSLQLFPAGPAIVSDRYTYLSYIGLFFVIAELSVWVIKKARRCSRIAYVIALSACVCAAAALFFLTRQRCAVWKDSFTLWDNAVNNYSSEYIPSAYFNRGLVYIERGEDAIALNDLYLSLRLYYNKLGETGPGFDPREPSLRVEYGYSGTYDYLAVNFAEIGRPLEALILLKSALKMNPLNGRAWFNLCGVYGNDARYQEAIAAGLKAVELLPDSSQAYYSLAQAYYLSGQYGQACRYNQRALALGFEPGSDRLNIAGSCPK